MKYQEYLHTPSALSEQLENIHKTNPDALLIGSIGRSMLMGEFLGDSAAEFSYRNESPEKKIENGRSLARDIDVVNLYDTALPVTGPFEVDLIAFGSRHVKFIQEGDTWFLVSESQNVYEELHPAVMEPVIGETVYGARGKTVPFQTHQALFGLKGAMRPKDKSNLDFLSSYAAHNKNWLPEGFYEPFDKLRLAANSGWLHQTRRMYRTLVPFSMRQRMTPLTGALKERLT